MTPRELAERWRTDAETFERYDDAQLAAICRRHADDLDAALRSADDELLTLAEAAREGGYSPDRLRHMIAEGQLPNAGTKGRPRVARRDLPRKAKRSTPTLTVSRPNAFDAAAVAREVVGR